MMPCWSIVWQLLQGAPAGTPPRENPKCSVLEFRGARVSGHVATSLRETSTPPPPPPPTPHPSALSLCWIPGPFGMDIPCSEPVCDVSAAPGGVP